MVVVRAKSGTNDDGGWSEIRWRCLWEKQFEQRTRWSLLLFTLSFFFVRDEGLSVRLKDADVSWVNGWPEYVRRKRVSGDVVIGLCERKDRRRRWRLICWWEWIPSHKRKKERGIYIYIRYRWMTVSERRREWTVVWLLVFTKKKKDASSTFAFAFSFLFFCFFLSEREWRDIRGG